MFEFWHQNLVRHAYDFGAKFQKYVSENEDGIYYYKMTKNKGNNNFRLQSAWYLKEDPWEAAGKATTTEELERKVGKEEAF